MKAKTEFSARGLPLQPKYARPRCECMDCGRFADSYMVHTHIWRRAFGILTRDEESPDISGHLCFECLEHRLGRELVLDDFTLFPINRGIFLGAAIAKGAPP